MNVIKNIGNEIKEINTNFLLNLENYENVFFNTLNEPNNNIYISELSRKNGILENIDSRAFVVKNQMNKLIDNMTNEMNSMNTDMERIKKENIILKEKAKILHKDVLTSDGLYDVMSNLEICNFINNKIKKNISKKNIVKLLVKYAIKKGSQDNVSCIITFI